jgi:hypothetical protein
MGMDRAGPHLSLSRAALATQEDGLLPPQGLNGRRDDVALGGQHRPFQVHHDHGIGRGDVEGLESLPGAVGDQRAIAIQVFLDGFAVHRKRFPAWMVEKLRHHAEVALFDA